TSFFLVAARASKDGPGDSSGARERIRVGCAGAPRVQDHLCFTVRRPIHGTLVSHVRRNRAPCRGLLRLPRRELHELRRDQERPKIYPQQSRRLSRRVSSGLLPQMTGGLSMAGFLGALISSIIFSVLGVVIFWLSFAAIDRLTPYDLWKEISQERNLALAVIVGAMSLGICTIIAAAIHG